MIRICCVHRRRHTVIVDYAAAPAARLINKPGSRCQRDEVLLPVK
jgi:hypothetical protein